MEDLLFHHAYRSQEYIGLIRSNMIQATGYIPRSPLELSVTTKTEKAGRDPDMYASFHT